MSSLKTSCKKVEEIPNIVYNTKTSQMTNTERNIPQMKMANTLKRKHYNIGIKDIFECFMMVLNYRAAVLKPQS